MAFAVSLKLHPHVRRLDDEWSGVTDPTSRRKLQNRLNQRAYRRRKAIESDHHTDERRVDQGWLDLAGRAFQDDLTHPDAVASISSAYGIAKSVIPTDRDGRASEKSDQGATTNSFCPGLEAVPNAWNESTTTLTIRPWNPVAKNPEPLPSRIARCRSLADPESPMHTFWALTAAQESWTMKMPPSKDTDHRHGLRWLEVGLIQLEPCLPADHLLSLIYYNVFRAFMLLIRTLRLEVVNLCHQDDQSPFVHHTNQPELKDIPQILHPTKLQRVIPHHPMVDLFPSAAARDNMLLKGVSHHDDGKMCDDLIGNGNYECDFQSYDGVHSEERRGLIVWGDPFDVANWEVGDGFAKKWRWLFEGATDLEKSTNAWRSKREESYLRIA